MIVTRIEPLSRSQSRIYLDDRFAFVLYKGELRLYGIREGETLKEDVYEQIVGELLEKRATVRSMNLLNVRPYTRRQLADKLEKELYPPRCIEAALRYVSAYGYVNDERYAQEYIACMQTKKSRRVLEAELLRRGIDAEQVQTAFRTLEENEEAIDEETLARQWLKKRGYDPERADYGQKQKMAAFLYRKGIGSAAICRAVWDGQDDMGSDC